jgi:hypothetical protein
MEESDLVDALERLYKQILATSAWEDVIESDDPDEPLRDDMAAARIALERRGVTVPHDTALL